MAAAAVVLLAAALAGCQATTTVAVRVDRSGSGTVTVSVALDAAADAVVGGLSSTFDSAGLAAAGWTVRGPLTTAGVTTVSASHTFSDLAELPAILGEVAASGGEPLFRLRVTESRSFFERRARLSGTVDLACGVDCFGDAGLERTFGSQVGVDPASLEHQYGETPAQALRFALTVRLPGKVTRTNAVSRAGGVLRWSPELGASLSIRAATSQTDQAHVDDVIEAASAAAAAVLVAAVAALGVRWRRRRLHR